MHEWLRLAADRTVVRRALAVAGVVGTILVVINHANALLAGDITLARTTQIITTMLVPYCVSTYSSVGAMLDARRSREAAPRV